MKFTKTGGSGGIDSCRMTGADGIEQRAIAFCKPQHSIYVIRFTGIFDQTDHKVAPVRIQIAESPHSIAEHVHLGQFLDVGHRPPEGVDASGIDLHAALFSFGQNQFKNVQIPVVGRFCFFQNRIRVVLWMWSRVISAHQVQVVVLHAMIRKGLAVDLSSVQAPVPTKRIEENGVDRSLLLEIIQYPINTLIDKRNTADLNADGFFRSFLRGGQPVAPATTTEEGVLEIYPKE